jgi:cob(I)alamin adenosyltransferase
VVKLYTKTGDDGSTGLIGGSRASKADPRVQAYGEVDETNATIGLARSAGGECEFDAWLAQIQADLFVLGAELASPGTQPPRHAIAAADITRLEGWIDDASAPAPPLKNFILPGGCETAARLHLARCVCRRAERATVWLSEQQRVRSEAIIYLNRLSDLLFALARLANHRANRADVIWSAPPQ